MRYNHAYSITFSVDSDEKDPYEVPAKVLVDALLKRIRMGGNLKWLEGWIDEMVECFETIDTWGMCFETIDKEED